MRRFLHLALAAAAMAGAVRRAEAYVLTGTSWPAGSIVMQLQLGTPSTPLSDGSAAWGDVALSALQEWNAQIARSQFSFVRDSTVSKVQGNRANNVFFSPDVYGQAWGSGVLAVTLTLSTSRAATSESDVLFNSARAWDSYRGALLRNTMDFRRVALHEFGHVLGLDHPDQAAPPQNVVSIMNSIVGNIETLQVDDITGAQLLYAAPTISAATGSPQIISQPASSSVQVTGSYTLNVGATGTGPLTYTWRFRAAGASISEPFPLATGPSYTIGSVQPADAGTYSVTVSNASGTIASNTATLSVAPITTTSNTTLANISTRGVVGTDAGVLIAGLVIGGSTPKNVVVRAVGPSLAIFGVPNSLQDPQLRIVDNAGRVVAQNDNWEDGGNATQLSAAFTRVGAFQFSTGSYDSAILATLPPGNYTAQVSNASGMTGVALVEAYDADADAATSRTRRLLNIATRGQVGTGGDALIAGLVVAGPGPHTYLIRAVGSTLASLGVTGTLTDPFLQIYKGETLLRENDDWDTPSSAQPALRDAAAKVGAFALQARTDSAMLITLQPGSYTAKVTGFNGVTGIALVEVYEVP
jgi:hypothetical protein